MGGLYLIMAFLCRLFLHHHPSHIGIKIRGGVKQSNFFVD